MADTRVETGAGDQPVDSGVSGNETSDSKADVRVFARYCAKMSDFLVFSIPYAAIMFGVGLGIGALALSVDNPALADLIFGTGGESLIVWGLIAWLTTLVLFPLAEALVISLFGTTPGKALMGIRVTGPDGQKLGFGASYARSLKCYVMGLGAGIPLLNLIAAILAFGRLTNHGATTWDEPVDYQTRPVNPVRWTFGILLAIGNIAANIADRFLSGL